jgi:hypothetical protein
MMARRAILISAIKKLKPGIVGKTEKVLLIALVIQPNLPPWKTEVPLYYT